MSAQPTILELADRYAKELFMGRGDEARKQLQAAIMNAETAAHTELEQMKVERDVALARLAKLPDTCDGKEQEAFEVFANADHFDMSQHPLHYLFLNSETSAARQGWKAAILYCRKQVDAATGSSPQPSQTLKLSDEQFNALWVESGRQYGKCELENVRLGWTMARKALNIKGVGS